MTERREKAITNSRRMNQKGDSYEEFMKDLLYKLLYSNQGIVQQYEKVSFKNNENSIVSSREYLKKSKIIETTIEFPKIIS